MDIKDLEDEIEDVNPDDSYTSRKREEKKEKDEEDEKDVPLEDREHPCPSCGEEMSYRKGSWICDSCISKGGE